jgi:predicted Rossmann fold nucleotide-binding protein DprA/Smf involved in DNA uptake
MAKRAARAKKRSRSGRAGSQSSRARTRAGTGHTVEDKIVEYAEELGRAIGAVRARMDTWQGERQQLINQLSAAVDDAKNLLTDLGQRAQRTGQQLASRAREMTSGRGARRRTAVKVPKRTAGGPDRKRHTLPATTRRKLASARRK